MFSANGICSKESRRDVEDWHQHYGERQKPSALLREFGEAGWPCREAKPKRRCATDQFGSAPPGM
jgi:hypothetical protein